jgi:putative DNA primase/helicase
MNFKHRALPLAERGFLVFPIYGVTPWGCQCGKKPCPSAGKHPIIRNWAPLASSNVGDIEEWSKQHAHANVGIATGHGLLVIDVDTPSSAVSQEILPLLPETLSATTGRGFHHFFSVPMDTPLSANVFGGLDVRYTGAYVLGAGSVHKNGKKYAWANAAPIARLPEEVIERLVALKRGMRGNTPRQSIEKRVHVGYYWSVGVRRTKLMGYAANLQYQGYTDDQIRGSTRDENLRRCKPDPLEQGEVDEIIQHILSKPKGR